MISLPTRDLSQAPKRQAMLPAALILRELIQNGHKVYVHCNCGIGRAVAAVQAYLVCFEDWLPELATFYMSAIRPISYSDLDGLRLVKTNFARKFPEKKRQIES